MRQGHHSGRPSTHRQTLHVARGPGTPVSIHARRSHGYGATWRQDPRGTAPAVELMFPCQRLAASEPLGAADRSGRCVRSQYIWRRSQLEAPSSQSCTGSQRRRPQRQAGQRVRVSVGGFQLPCRRLLLAHPRLRLRSLLHPRPRPLLRRLSGRTRHRPKAAPSSLHEVPRPQSWQIAKLCRIGWIQCFRSGLYKRVAVGCERVGSRPIRHVVIAPMA